MPANRPLYRDLVLLIAAGAIGWWAYGANHPVRAGVAALEAHGDANLAFEYGGLGPDGQLTLYNPGNHTLYVYPSVGRSANSHIPCLYSVRVEKAGAPLERENCPAGSFFAK